MAAEAETQRPRHEHNMTAQMSWSERACRHGLVQPLSSPASPVTITNQPTSATQPSWLVGRAAHGLVGWLVGVVTVTNQPTTVVEQPVEKH